MEIVLFFFDEIGSERKLNFGGRSELRGDQRGIKDEKFGIIRIDQIVNQ
jgi:hypothetical protein